MVMTSSGGYGRRTFVKGSSSSKGKTFNQEGLAMDLIDVEPLSLASPSALVPYDTFEEDASTLITLEKHSPSSVEESPNDQGPNLERNLVQTPTVSNGSDTKPEGTKEDKPDSYQFVR